MTTGEQIGAAVDATVQQSQADAQAQIDAAKADADAAARQAKAIADAALSTELGGRIDATRQEFDTWRASTDQRIMEVAETNRRLETQSAEAMTLLGSIRALLTPPAPKAEEAPPPTAQGTVQTDGNSGKTGQNEQHVKAETPAPAPQRKRHFL